jgi:farnesyl diphosphate synthase
MTKLDTALHDVSDALYQKMEMLLPEVDGSGESLLLEAMRYSALAPGKRLRPFLTVVAANLFGVSRDSALQAAAAIEFVHTYSLIHDDLPAMDNDDVRRGQPSSHVKFDEATAILAGDGLLTYAFEVLADKSTHSSNTVRCELIRCLAKASGPRGMVGGQMMDLHASKEDEIAINKIIRLQRLKTGELFAISCEAGAILGNASMNLRNLLRGYAHDIGLAFQITDDLLDATSVNESSIERMDKSSEKATFVNAMGVEKAREQARVLADQAKRHLHTFGKKADLLRDLADFIVNREQ